MFLAKRRFSQEPHRVTSQKTALFRYIFHFEVVCRVHITEISIKPLSRVRFVQVE
jgi:hypothetical protein